MCVCSNSWALYSIRLSRFCSSFYFFLLFLSFTIELGVCWFEIRASIRNERNWIWCDMKLIFLPRDFISKQDVLPLKSCRYSSSIFLIVQFQHVTYMATRENVYSIFGLFIDRRMNKHNRHPSFNGWNNHFHHRGDFISLFRFIAISSLPISLNLRALYCWFGFKRKPIESISLEGDDKIYGKATILGLHDLYYTYMMHDTRVLYFLFVFLSSNQMKRNTFRDECL